MDDRGSDRVPGTGVTWSEAGTGGVPRGDMGYQSRLWEVSTQDDGVLATMNGWHYVHDSDGGVQLGYFRDRKDAEEVARRLNGEMRGHDGDCTIYASTENGRPEDGVCTCGFGRRLVREGDWSQMYSEERVPRTAQGNTGHGDTA